MVMQIISSKEKLSFLFERFSVLLPPHYDESLTDSLKIFKREGRNQRMWAHREEYTETRAWCESSKRYSLRKQYRIAYGLGNYVKTQKRKETQKNP